LDTSAAERLIGGRMLKKLYVGGLPFSTSNDGLRALFAEVGGVESAALVTDQMTGQSRGFGYVQMVSDADAALAIRKLHRKEVDGRKLTVHLAIPQRSR
jgi:RNA recognition motif-containing protein